MPSEETNEAIAHLLELGLVTASIKENTYEIGYSITALGYATALEYGYEPEEQTA